MKRQEVAGNAGDRVSQLQSSESDVAMLVAFRRGLNEAGYVEGRNLASARRFRPISGASIRSVISVPPFPSEVALKLPC
jgi:hypothetical protein